MGAAALRAGGRFGIEIKAPSGARPRSAEQEEPSWGSAADRSPRSSSAGSTPGQPHSGTLHFSTARRAGTTKLSQKKVHSVDDFYGEKRTLS